jgi:predicted amino acid-binding ACT domain protein
MASSSGSAPAVLPSSSRLWFQRVKSIPAKYPMAFGIVLSGFKTSLSDLLVQKVVERKERVDWKRNAAFASFGFVYLGGVQYVLYVPVFGRLFPNAAKFAAKPIAQKVKDVRGMLQLAGQTFLDQCVHHPLMYFPAFYITKELVMAKDGRPDIPRVLAEYRANVKEDLLALWKIWVPAMLLNFAFMPMHLRIPFVAGVSLLWTMVLSAMRGGDVVHAQDMAGGAVTGSTYHIFEESLDFFNTTPVEMGGGDMDHFSISAAGKQRPGLVAMLARHVADHGANVTHSKMVRLGQEFIIQMHVAVPKPSKEFLRSLKHSKALRTELDIQATPLTQRVCPEKKAVIGIRIYAVGQDR